MSKDIPWNNAGKTCGACAEAKIDAIMCNHVRVGKTKFEHAEGTHKNRFENRAARTAWGYSSNAANATFPRSSCNGKKNRFHV